MDYSICDSVINTGLLLKMTQYTIDDVDAGNENMYKTE